MSKVKMVASTKTGNVVNQYENSTKGFGYMNLRQTLVTFGGNQVNTENRSCLLRGNVEKLKAAQEQYPEGSMPGRIRVVECLESAAMRVSNGMADKTDIGDATALAELHSEIIKTDMEKAIEGFVKKNPKNNTILTKDGERILRFQVYDATGELADIKIQHDAEVAAPVETIDAE
jgi:hypothetical protein